MDGMSARGHRGPAARSKRTSSPTSSCHGDEWRSWPCHLPRFENLRRKSTHGPHDVSSTEQAQSAGVEREFAPDGTQLWDGVAKSPQCSPRHPAVYRFRLPTTWPWPQVKVTCSRSSVRLHCHVGPPLPPHEAHVKVFHQAGCPGPWLFEGQGHRNRNQDTHPALSH